MAHLLVPGAGAAAPPQRRADAVEVAADPATPPDHVAVNIPGVDKLNHKSDHGRTVLKDKKKSPPAPLHLGFFTKITLTAIYWATLGYGLASFMQTVATVAWPVALMISPLGVYLLFLIIAVFPFLWVDMSSMRSADAAVEEDRRPASPSPSMMSDRPRSVVVQFSTSPPPPSMITTPLHCSPR